MTRIFIVKDNNKYICFNVDNDEDADQLLATGARELPQQQVTSIFGEYANLADPNNTTVSEDGNDITFNYTPPSLEELKADKLNELKTIFKQFEQNVCKDMVIQSSLGFPVDADRRSQSNIQGQLTVLNSNNTLSIPYRCADNLVRNLTIAELNTVYKEMLINSQNLYTQKWQLEQAINDATSEEQLNTIQIQFTMLGFTQNYVS